MLLQGGNSTLNSTHLAQPTSTLKLTPEGCPLLSYLTHNRRPNRSATRLCRHLLEGRLVHEGRPCRMVQSMGSMGRREARHTSTDCESNNRQTVRTLQAHNPHCMPTYLPTNQSTNQHTNLPTYQTYLETYTHTHPRPRVPAHQKP